MDVSPLDDRLRRTLHARQLILDHAARARPRTLEEVHAHLVRMNLPWKRVPTSAEPPELDFLQIEARPEALGEVKRLLRWPLIYRLNYIKQLSTTAIGRNLDGTHTRLSHSLGTVQYAGFFLDVLDRHLRSASEARPPIEPITPRERLAVLLLAAIHDAFAMPFGHPMDLVKDVLVGPEKARKMGKLDKHFLHLALDRVVNGDRDINHPLLHVLFDVITSKGYRDQEAWGLIHDVARLSRPKHPPRLLPAPTSESKEQFVPSEWRYFLFQIVDSLIDADRLDYIQRDEIHLLGERADPTPVQRLLHGMRVAWGKDAHEKRPRARICFDLGDAELVGQILSRRRRLYARFYDSPEKLALDNMLAHATYYVLAENDLAPIAPTGSTPEPEARVRRGILDELSLLVDADLIHLLRTLARSYYPMDLLDDILTNNPYVPIHEPQGVPQADLARTRDRIWQYDGLLRDLVHVDGEGDGEDTTHFQGLLADADARFAPAADLPPLPAGRGQRFVDDEADAEVATHEEPLAKAELTLYFAWQLTSGFLRRYQVERALWRDLLADVDVSEAFDAYLTERYGLRHGRPESVEIIRELKAYPHVHLAVPSFLPMEPTQAGHESHSREPKEPENERALAFYDRRTGNVQFLVPPIPSLPAEDAQPLLVLAPAPLARDLACRRAVARTLDRVIESRLWLCSWWPLLR